MYKYDRGLCHHEIPRGFDRTARNDPQSWVAALMASYVGKDLDYPNDIQQAVQRIEARVSGTPCDFPFEHDEWSHHWKSGYGAD